METDRFRIERGKCFRKPDLQCLGDDVCCALGGILPSLIVLLELPNFSICELLTLLCNNIYAAKEIFLLVCSGLIEHPFGTELSALAFIVNNIWGGSLNMVICSMAVCCLSSLVLVLLNTLK